MCAQVCSVFEKATGLDKRSIIFCYLPQYQFISRIHEFLTLVHFNTALNNLF